MQDGRLLPSRSFGRAVGAACNRLFLVDCGAITVAHAHAARAEGARFPGCWFRVVAYASRSSCGGRGSLPGTRRSKLPPGRPKQDFIYVHVLRLLDGKGDGPRSSSRSLAPYAGFPQSIRTMSSVSLPNAASSWKRAYQTWPHCLQELPDSEHTRELPEAVAGRVLSEVRR